MIVATRSENRCALELTITPARWLTTKSHSPKRKCEYNCGRRTTKYVELLVRLLLAFPSSRATQKRDGAGHSIVVHQDDGMKKAGAHRASLKLFKSCPGRLHSCTHNDIYSTQQSPSEADRFCNNSQGFCPKSVILVWRYFELRCSPLLL